MGGALRKTGRTVQSRQLPVNDRVEQRRIYESQISASAKEDMILSMGFELLDVNLYLCSVALGQYLVITSGYVFLSRTSV
ncbi:MAG TPA: hypothetical protein DCP92_10860 [Nitrospiraceae bacterium]|nr:hypothetical protein [Nitrospiraceae bacterium]